MWWSPVWNSSLPAHCDRLPSKRLTDKFSSSAYELLSIVAREGSPKRASLGKKNNLRMGEGINEGYRNSIPVNVGQWNRKGTGLSRMAEVDHPVTTPYGVVMVGICQGAGGYGKPLILLKSNSLLPYFTTVPRLGFACTWLIQYQLRVKTMAARNHLVIPWTWQKKTWKR